MNERRTTRVERPLKSFRTLMTFRLHAVGGASERYSERYYKRLSGLNLPECRVIGITGAQGTVTFKAVCELAHLEKSYASRIIHRLADRGFIRKEENPDDQRSILLSLTEEGEKLRNELHSAAAALNRRLLAVLSPEQTHTFMTCLTLLQEQLEELDQGGDALLAAMAEDGAGNGKDMDDLGEQLTIDISLARQLHFALGSLIARSE